MEKAKTPVQVEALAAALGQPGLNYSIEKSTNLHAWSVFSTATLPNTALTIRDPAATNPGPAFYRARLVGP